MFGRLMRFIRGKRHFRDGSSPFTCHTTRISASNKGPSEEFLSEVQRFGRSPIRRLDWLPGEFFIPDGRCVMHTGYDAYFMTGELVTPKEQRKAAFYPFEQWCFWNADENHNERACTPLPPGASCDGGECRVVMDSTDLTVEQVQANNDALRATYSNWRERIPFTLRLWRMQERFTPAIIYNTLSGERVDNDQYRLRMCFNSMGLDGYVNVMQHPEGMRIGVCLNGQGFKDKDILQESDALFLEVPDWWKVYIPSASFCSACGHLIRNKPEEHFVCPVCGREHKWIWRDDAPECTGCGAQRRDGQYCVVCCTRHDTKYGNIN